MWSKLFLVLSAALAALAHEGHDHSQSPRRAIAKLSESSTVRGNVTFTELDDGRVHVTGVIVGLTPGRHGFHVHEKGDLTNGCLSAGSHFNPDNESHAGPEDSHRHAGDLGNVLTDEQGNTKIDIVDSKLSLQGKYSVIGRAVVVHEKVDDLGKGENLESRKTGNAGGRAACGVIGVLELPAGNAAGAATLTAAMAMIPLMTAALHFLF